MCFYHAEPPDDKAENQRLKRRTPPTNNRIVSSFIKARQLKPPHGRNLLAYLHSLLSGLAASIYQHGGIFKIMGRDRLRETEAELARVARALSVGELATSIAHEINQPLASVVTNAEAGLRS